MSLIRQQNGASPWLVPPRCLIGRSRVCQLRVACPETSGEHALLRWRNGVWELQDLHSRNGTYIDGHRLGPGRVVGLAEGARLGFGRPDQFHLCDGGPPRPHASGLYSPHPIVEAQDELLFLPGPERVEVTVFSRDRRWWLERDDTTTPIEDGDLVHTRGEAWRLHLPDLGSSTRDADDVAPSLEMLALRFVVSGGAVELQVSRGDVPIELKARAHHALILALARVRLAVHGPWHDDAGWIDQDELLQQLGYDANRFHVEIHRIRRQFAEAGVLDATRIIERREGTKQLRIGVTRLEIVDLGLPAV